MFHAVRGYGAPCWVRVFFLGGEGGEGVFFFFFFFFLRWGVLELIQEDVLPRVLEFKALGGAKDSWIQHRLDQWFSHSP